MAKFRAYASVTGGKYLGEIEAENADEATAKAYELSECYINLCHQCSRECEDAQVADISVDEVNDE